MADTPAPTPDDEQDQRQAEANANPGQVNSPAEAEDDDEGGSPVWLAATVVAIAAWGLSLAVGWKLASLLFAVVLISIVIKEACDPFADAAQWVGDTFHIPGSVRGATLDAIASSMPELFSGIFFVVVAMSAISHLDAEGNELTEEETIAAEEIAGAKGYGSTIATCAGSAVYNMILIPAFCAIFISYFRPKRPTIDIEDEVIARDGMWFVSCEIILILFLFNNQMHWWMAFAFLGLYAIYILQLVRDAKLYRQRMQLVVGRLQAVGVGTATSEIVEGFEAEGVKIPDSLIDKARARLRGKDVDGEDDDAPDSAGAFFGYWAIPLSGLSATVILTICTCAAAGACYFLVEVTYATAELLAVPAFFVAVIIAAAASSVPDTLLSIGSAKRGDDSGAVSNAFGSNIFDICVCLSIPLLVNSFLNGWQPVSLLQENGEPIEGLVGLRILLVTLTVVTLAIIWHNRQLTRNKAFVLCGLYLLFIAYAVIGSLSHMLSEGFLGGLFN